jgi:gliding motility-associated-like protein
MKKKILVLLYLLLPICSFAQLTPAEGFEGTTFPPAGWLITNNGIGNPALTWLQASGSAAQPAYAGSHAAFLDRENVAAGTVAADYLVTKEFEYPANAQLHFFSRLIITGNQQSVFKFYLLDAANNTIIPNEAATYPAPFLTWSENDFNPQLNYTERIIDLPAGTVGNNYRVVFAMENDNGDRWVLDQISVLSKCLDPVNLSVANAALNTADLSWDNPGNATSWEIEIVPENGAPTGTGVVYSGALPFHATAENGLEAATNYKYYVRAICGDGAVSAWVGPKLFNTTLCPVENQCNYTFILTDWNNGWGENTMIVSQNGITVATLQLVNSATNTVTVPLCNGPFQLSTNSGLDFVYTAGVQVINPFGQILYDKEVGDEALEILYSGTVDCTGPACLPVQNIIGSDSSLTSVNLSWAGPATGNWQYYVTEQGGQAPTADALGILTTTNPVTVTGLNAATSYDFYVKTICIDEQSAWVGPLNYSTAVCDASQKCTFYFEMTSNGSGYFGHTMTILQGGATVATIGSTFTEGLTATVAVALCPDVPIDIVWTADADGLFTYSTTGLNVYTPYMEVFFSKPAGTGVINSTIFTGMPSCNPPACLKPQQLYANNITAHSATIGWTEMGAATNWEYYIVPLNSPAPENSQSGTPATVTTAAIANLQSGTFYTLYVRAICGGSNGNSSWSVVYVFVTKIENDECTNATDIPVNTGTDCTLFITGTMDGSTTSGQMPSCIIDGVAGDVWYKFTATAQEHTVSITSLGSTFSYVSIYQGNNCGNLEEMTCTQNPITMISNLTIGATYYVKVFTEYLEEGLSSQFELCITTPAPIIVTDVFEDNEVTAMVNDVLITSGCAQVSNISFSGYGLGKFEKGNSTFALSEGIILSTGTASSAMGPNFSQLSDGTEDWAGDTDLYNYMQTINSDPGLSVHFNATVLEFDFTPFTSHISFPFIFASEEYGMYQCEYSDAFAFFLTDITANTPTTNLAVLPGTTIPVSVTTIRDEAFNPGCISQNPEYFDTYYGGLGGGADPLTSPTNFEGNTVQLLAQSDVVSGHTYHIKLVIADEGDFAYDSAVFLGSFNVGGVNLGPDLTVQNGTAPCAGEAYVIETNLSTADYSFTWYKNDVLIAGATGTSLTVTQDGEYAVTTHDLDAFCDNTDSVVVEFYDVLQKTNNPVNLTLCNTSGYATFNLATNTTAILQGLTTSNFTISYHATLSDANTNSNSLALSYTNTVQNLQTIYVRIYNNTLQCTGIKTFNLVVGDLAPQFTVNNNFSICQGSSATITVVPGNFAANAVTYAWTQDGQPLANTTGQINVLQSGTYAVSVNYGGCTVTQTVVVTVIAPPVADAPANVSACSYELPQLNENSTYHTEANGLGAIITAGTIIKTTQTIYVYAVNQLGCTNQNSFTVTILPTVSVTVTQGCEDNGYILEVNFDSDVNTDTASFAWTDANGTTLGTNSPKIAVTAAGIYNITVTPDALSGCPVTIVVTVDNIGCMIPKGISPNGDDKNDNFDLSGFDISKLSIFNRYGIEVYSKNAYTNQWHGQTDGGDKLPTGTYYYAITFSTGASKTGWVYINRQE